MNQATTRVFIPVLTYQNPDWAMQGSMLGTHADLLAHRIAPEVPFLPPSCYIAFSRNLAAYLFLQSNCTHLFFWDTDVAAPAPALRRLISHDQDIVIAPYPKKVTVEGDSKWPVRLTSGEPDERGLIEAEGVATGFLLIKRHVIETMYEKYRADREFAHSDADTGLEHLIVDLFPTGLLDFMPRYEGNRRAWWGEDYAFSQLARDAGFRIWLDPRIPLGHAGRQMWHGDFAALADKPGEAA